MEPAYHTLVSLFLPKGIPDCFDLINGEKEPRGLRIYLEGEEFVSTVTKSAIADSVTVKIDFTV